MGVIQRRDGACFLLKAFAEMLNGKLDSHATAQARIAGAIHLSHTTRSNERKDLIWTQASSRGQWHRVLADSNPLDRCTEWIPPRKMGFLEMWPSGPGWAGRSHLGVIVAVSDFGGQESRRAIDPPLSPITGPRHCWHHRSSRGVL